MKTSLSLLAGRVPRCQPHRPGAARHLVCLSRRTCSDLNGPEHRKRHLPPSRKWSSALAGRLLTSGSSYSPNLPALRRAKQWCSSGFVPGYSCGAATVSHRLPWGQALRPVPLPRKHGRIQLCSLANPNVRDDTPLGITSQDAPFSPRSSPAGGVCRSSPPFDLSACPRLA